VTDLVVDTDDDCAVRASTAVPRCSVPTWTDSTADDVASDRPSGRVDACADDRTGNGSSMYGTHAW
jgi:hypothetical protein